MPCIGKLLNHSGAASFLCNTGFNKAILADLIESHIPWQWPFSLCFRYQFTNMWPCLLCSLGPCDVAQNPPVAHMADAAAYLDDINIYTNDSQWHLRAVLRPLRWVGLSENPMKWVTGWVKDIVRCRKVWHLGHGRCIPKLIRSQQLWSNRDANQKGGVSFWGWLVTITSLVAQTIKYSTTESVCLDIKWAATPSFWNRPSPQFSVGNIFDGIEWSYC